MLKLISIFLLAIFVFAFTAIAQDAVETEADETEDWKLERGSKEWSLELGYAPMQPTFLSGREEYDTKGRKFALGSFRWGRVIGTTKGVTFQ